MALFEQEQSHSHHKGGMSMRKFLTILLVCGLVLLCACGKQTQDADKPQDTLTGNYKAAVAAIDSGDYRTAYDLLRNATDEHSKELLSRFVFVPTTITSAIRGETYDMHFSTELIYDAKGNVLRHIRIDKGDKVETVYTYTDGRLSKEIATSDDFTRTEEYNYDANGRLIRHHRTDCSDDRIDETTYTYVFDENGNLTDEKRISVYGDGSCQEVTTNYLYDEGKLIEEKRVAKDDDTISTTVVTTYRYNADGKEIYKKIDLGLDYLISENPTEFYTEYRADGTLYKYTERDGNDDRVTEYDEKGREWRLWFYPTNSLDNKPYIFYEYTYDNADRVVKKTYAEGADYYTYDEKGNRLTAERIFLNGDTQWAYTYTYDADGRMLSEVHTYGDGKAETTTNTYDADGNRITQIYKGFSSETGEAITITENVAWTLFYYPNEVPEVVEEELYSLTIPPNAA